MSFLVQHVKKVLEGNGKKSMVSWLLSWEGLKMFGDGNVGFFKLFKGPTAGTLVGEDHLGNKYYENESLPYSRKRWVLYKDTFDYNSSGIPPEWHGWVNYINDLPPTKHQFDKPIYGVEAYITRTGTPAAYAPKGVWANPQKRNWLKYEAWQPTKQQS